MTASRMSIITFLLARFSEERQAAQETAFPDPDEFSDRFLLEGKAEATRWMLTECEAKQRIVRLHAASHYCIPHSGHTDTGRWYESDHVYPWPCPTLALLALPYVDHPDYREEWRP